MRQPQVGCDEGLGREADLSCGRMASRRSRTHSMSLQANSPVAAEAQADAVAIDDDLRCAVDDNG